MFLRPVGAGVVVCRVPVGFRQNRQLYWCPQRSVQEAVVVAAEVGLEMNTKRGHAFITPRPKYERGAEKTEANLGSCPCIYIQGWRGLMFLARTSGLVTGLNAQIIYANEKYSIQQGTEPRLEHIQNPDTETRGKPIAAYAVLFLSPGG